jgi:DegV family protein with EDD domain
MGDIKIITDSTCDLNENIRKQKDILVIPLYVLLNDKSYKDGEEINTTELFLKIHETNIVPKTAAISPVDYYKAFKPYIDEGKNIIYIGLSSKMSSTIQNAYTASHEFPEGRIEIVDSENLSTGIGLLVLKAVDFVNEGFEFHEIAAKVRKLSPHVKVSFVIDTLEYIYKGGRCTSIEKFMGGVLKIKPIISVLDGKMVLSQKLIGRKKAIDTMLENTLKDSEKMDLTRISITHAFAIEDAEYLKTQLKSKLKVKEIITNEAGCVISSHCGKNTVGILYITK